MHNISQTCLMSYPFLSVYTWTIVKAGPGTSVLNICTGYSIYLTIPGLLEERALGHPFPLVKWLCKLLFLLN